MRLIGLLSWYDEHPAWLAELVASMGRVGVDHVVAVDGAYALFPQATGQSASEQAQTVLATAAGVGMGVTVHVPQFAWAGNEVAKRDWMFAAAELVAMPGEDWLWVCDADEVIVTAPDLSRLLAETRCDVCEVLLVGGEGSHPVRRLFRAHPRGIHVDGHHSRYVDGDGLVLWDSRRRDTEVQAESVWNVRMRHRQGDRATLRNARRETYYDRRDERQIEVV